MASEALLEELEVLESIYPTELQMSYPEAYPDVLPELKLAVVDGELTESEIGALIKDLLAIGEENLGMAMTFTLVSHLREQLSKLSRSKKQEQDRIEKELERLALEEEEAKTRGTPVTLESFKAWKAKFDKEMGLKKAQEEDEKLKGLTPKEREEYKKAQQRLSGRQLFERNKNLDTQDEALIEEGTVSVDISQYERTREEEEQDEGITFSDSD
ncbi:hypothetical protein H1R20_g34, partial [Candolleomyces eurysporus]